MCPRVTKGSLNYCKILHLYLYHLALACLYITNVYLSDLIAQQQNSIAVINRVAQ